MSDTIVVSVSELRSRLQDIRRDGMEYVMLSISEPDEFDGEVIPASIALSACKAHDTNVWADYDEVESLPDNENLIKECCLGIHMSSNLL